MPKRVKKFQTAKAPPIDWLWAAVLERQRVYGMTLEEMAVVAGITYPQMRRYIAMSPWDWSRTARERICEKFGIAINISPNLESILEVRVS